VAIDADRHPDTDDAYRLTGRTTPDAGNVEPATASDGGPVGASDDATLEDLIPLPVPAPLPPPSGRGGWGVVVSVVSVVVAVAVIAVLVGIRFDRDGLRSELATAEAEQAGVDETVASLAAEVEALAAIVDETGGRLAALEQENAELRAQVDPAMGTDPASIPAGPSPGAMQVTLTFDDGPHEVHTREAMDILEQHGVRGVFFVVGTEVQAHPDVAREIVERGHVIANHSWRHGDLTGMSDAEMEADLVRTNDLIEQTTGARPACMRPPFGKADDRVRAISERLGLSVVGWSVDTHDWQRPGTQGIVDNALNQINARAEQGSNVLMHDGGGDRATTMAALTPIIEAVKASGREVVTICG
jgi:peptidoglycan-N-acetylglucosamine deacetylase